MSRSLKIKKKKEGSVADVPKRTSSVTLKSVAMYEYIHNVATHSYYIYIYMYKHIHMYIFLCSAYI